MFTVAARRAGTIAAARPTPTAQATCSSTVSPLTSNTGKSVPTGRERVAPPGT